METKFKYLFISAIIGNALVLTGCTPGISPERYLTNMQEHMSAQGKPTSYVDGYVDGCSTGRRMAGDKKFSYKRNNVRADRDALYARGWQDGQINCRNEAIAEKQREEQERLGSVVCAEPTLQSEEAKRRSDAEIREIWEQIKK